VPRVPTSTRPCTSSLMSMKTTGDHVLSCLVTEMGPKLPDLHIGPSTHYDRLYVGLRDSNHSIRFYAHTDRNNDIHVAICQNSDNSTGKNHGFDSCCLASEKVGYQFPKLRLVISMLFYLKFSCRALILWVYILDFFQVYWFMKVSLTLHRFSAVEGLQATALSGSLHFAPLPSRQKLML